MDEYEITDEINRAAREAETAAMLGGWYSHEAIVKAVAPLIAKQVEAAVIERCAEVAKDELEKALEGARVCYGELTTEDVNDLADAMDAAIRALGNE